MSAHIARLGAARHKSIELRAFQHAMIYTLQVAWRDGNIVAVSRDAVLQLGREEIAKTPILDIAWLLIHESEHILRDHFGRADRFFGSSFQVLAKTAEGRGKLRRWNVAADLEINQHLPTSYIATAERAEYEKLLFPERYDLPVGKTAEWYYNNLPTDLQTNGGEGDGERGIGGTDMDPSAPDGGGGDSAAGDGSGKPRGRSAIEIQGAREACAKAIQGAGSVPGDLQVWANRVNSPPVVPWHLMVQQAVHSGISSSSGDTDQDYGRPSRRQAIYGFGDGVPRLPQSFGSIPRVDLYWDTSGSMGADEHGTLLEQLVPLFSQLQAQVRIWAGDTRVAKEGVAESLEEVAGLLKGGGGTDFRPFFDMVQKMEPHDRPRVVLMFTDGDGPMPAENPLPGGEIYYVLVGPYQCRPYTDGRSEVPYGTEIRVPVAK